MPVYYIANAGNDLNDGRSPETSWRSIEKINSALKGGDTVKFCCGDTFYGRIQPPQNADAVHPTVYTSYGEGIKPVISQYKKALSSSWERVSDDIWKLDLTDAEKYTGNTVNINSNAGFMKISGKIYPRKRFTPETLELRWDFYDDGKYIYVKSEKKPSELSDDIRFACNIGCMRFTDHLKVSNLSFIGSGGHGISGVVNGAVISDCEFHELGGSELKGYPTPNTRYGNGVECWSNSSNVTVEHCRFSGIYDVAITMQGNNVEKCWKNMVFRDNVMWNNQQCFEIWSSGGKPDTGFKNCLFENNICLDSGYCWGYDVRPNKDCSSHLLIYGLGCPMCDITVRNNVFSGARTAAIYKSGGPAAIPADYKVYGNTFIVRNGQDIAYRAGCTDDEYDKVFNKIACENTIYIADNY